MWIFISNLEALLFNNKSIVSNNCFATLACWIGVGRSRSWDRRRRSCMQRSSAQCHLVAKAHVHRGHGCGGAVEGAVDVVGSEAAELHAASAQCHLVAKMY